MDTLASNGWPSDEIRFVGALCLNSGSSLELQYWQHLMKTTSAWGTFLSKKADDGSIKWKEESLDNSLRESELVSMTGQLSMWSNRCIWNRQTKANSTRYSCVFGSAKNIDEKGPKQWAIKCCRERYKSWCLNKQPVLIEPAQFRSWSKLVEEY